MKKLLLYFGVGIGATVSDAWSAQNCCPCDWQVGQTAQYHANCTDSTFCNGCDGTITVSIVNGVCTPTCNSSGGGGGGGGGGITIKPSLNTCSQNQYKTTVGRLTTCFDCPNGGTTILLGGGSAITDCYLPGGTTVSGDSGVYIYTDDCFYSLAS